MAVQNINTYQGNAALGQGTAGGEGIIGAYDLKHVNDAMDKLVQYQVLYNRDRWARSNLLVDQDAKAAAEAMKFTIGNWDEPEKNHVMGLMKEFTQMFNDNPKRTRILPDGSNSAAVSEWMAKGYEIEWAIARANARKVQTNEIDKVIAGLTDEDEIAEAKKWKAQEDAKPIGEDKLLPPNITPFTPLPTPYTKAVDEIQYDDKGNVQQIWTVAIPDIAAGMANYTIVMGSKKGRKAKEFVSTGANDFNKLIQRVTQEEQSKTQKYQATGGPTEQDILNALEQTDEGASKMVLLKKYNQTVKLHNEYGERFGLSPEKEITWVNGVTETDYVKMLVGGGSGTVDKKVKTDYQGTAIKEQELAQRKEEERNQNARFYSNLRQQADQWKKEFEEGKDPEADPLIKNAVITTLLKTPESGVLDPATKMYSIAKTQELENIFAIPITKVKKTSGTGEEGADEFVEEFEQLEIQSIQAEKVGDDMNNTRIHVTYKHPKTGETTKNVFDRRALGLAADNVFGKTAAPKIAAAAAKFYRQVGTSNPTIEQMEFKNLNATPLPMKKEKGKWVRDNSKMIPGKAYQLPDGTIQVYNPTSK